MPEVTDVAEWIDSLPWKHLCKGATGKDWPHSASSCQGPMGLQQLEAWVMELGVQGLRCSRVQGCLEAAVLWFYTPPVHGLGKLLGAFTATLNL